jgi:hypothetical protein
MKKKGQNSNKKSDAIIINAIKMFNEDDRWRE